MDDSTTEEGVAGMNDGLTRALAEVTKGMILGEKLEDLHDFI